MVRLERGWESGQVGGEVRRAMGCFDFLRAGGGRGSWTGWGFPEQCRVLHWARW